MNNNTKSRFNQLKKSDRQALAQAGKPRKSTKAKVGRPSREHN